MIVHIWISITTRHHSHPFCFLVHVSIDYAIILSYVLQELIIQKRQVSRKSSKGTQAFHARATSRSSLQVFNPHLSHSRHQQHEMCREGHELGLRYSPFPRSLAQISTITPRYADSSRLMMPSQTGCRQSRMELGLRVRNDRSLRLLYACEVRV